MAILLLLLTILTLTSSEENQGKLMRKNRKLGIRHFVTSPLNDKDELRFVSFGTSVTYGSGLEDPETQTYIKLLSTEGNNLGMRASDPSYPSICTESMIGDDAIYDVIIIEYERRYDRGLEHLVQRLRERFPDALIICTDIWTFMTVSVFDKKSKERIDSFRGYFGKLGHTINNQTTWDVVKKEKDVYFEFDKHRLAPRKEYMANIERQYGAYIYSWAQHGPIRSIILRHLPLFAEDWVHLSESGHRFVAQNIERIIKTEKVKKSDRVGTWGEGDLCNSWLSTGIMKSSAVSDGVMEQFDDRWGGKHALNFEKSGYIVINNPFDGERELALTYMTTGPAPSIYPRTKIAISKSIYKFEVDPTDYFYDYPVHVQKTEVIGLVRPGKNRLNIHVLEEGKKPFRVVGFSITNESRKISKMYAKPM